MNPPPMATTSSNKTVLANQLKNTLNSLPEDDLIHVFTIFSSLSTATVDKSCKMMSYKCFEASYTCGPKKAKGYGRSEKEAHVHCIRNLLEFLLEEESVVILFRHSLSMMEGTTAEEDENNSNNNMNNNNGNQKENDNTLIWNSESVWKNSNKATNNNNNQNLNCPPHILSASIQVNNPTYSSNNQNATQSTNYNTQFIPPNVNHSTKSNSSHSITQTANFPSRDSVGNTTYSVPKDKPQVIQQYLNSSTDYSSTCSRAPLPRKSNVTDEVVVRSSLPSSQLTQYSQSPAISQQQSRQQHNKSVNSISVSLSHSQIDKEIENNNANSANAIKYTGCNEQLDAKWIGMEEELKRSKNYIDHLERKIKVVLEENKILKSLLLENKKQTKSVNAQVAVQDENIPPNQYLQNPQNKQQQQQLQQLQQQPQQQYQQFKQQKEKSISLYTNDMTSYHLHEPSNTLQDLANKININNNGTIGHNANTLDTIKTSPKNIPEPMQFNSKHNNSEKMRSLSFDVHGKGATVVTENSGKKLDTSFNECGIVGHRRVKSKIPKLNLEVLPNYHGKTSYQTTQPTKQNGVSYSNANSSYDKIK